MENLRLMNGKPCACGKKHFYDVENIVSGKGVVAQLPEKVKKFGAKKAFVLSDKNTFKVAGERVIKLLEDADITVLSFSFNDDEVVPDEKSVGLAIMHFDRSCDIIIGIGSGVINDIGKIVSAVSGKPYIIVATAPSMDGYASATSSMTRAGLKISLPSRAADVIIGDVDILKTVPLKMLKSGIGDMLAKYVSICEWRIANLITGEYYCENVAKLVRGALSRCVQNAQKLMERDEDAILAVFDGLVIGGVAMNYAGVSRPASGVEHYFSHVWDMRGVEFGLKVDFHGIQCAVGTLIASRLYEKIKKITPDKQKAITYVKNFDVEDWNAQLKSFLGKGALSMIELEKKEGKYDVNKHAKRIDVIIENWDKVIQIIEEELPSAQQIENVLNILDAPKTLSEIGVDENILSISFKATKDIRDKYVLSRLAFDLGVIEEIL